jgi:hypothetical protein
VTKWSEGRKLRFITLTLKHSATPLTDQLDKLHACFGKLRRSPAWATRITGGIAFLELKRSAPSDMWHPHLHILAEGRYLPHAELKAEWLRLTTDSSIVDIREVRDADHVARYVASYATKTLHYSVYKTPAALAEAMAALRGKRLYNCFGSCTLPEPEDAKDVDIWQPYCSLAILVNLADHGDPEAKSILHTLLRKRHLPPKPDTS